MSVEPGPFCGMEGPLGLPCTKRPHEVGKCVAIDPPGDPKGAIIKWPREQGKVATLPNPRRAPVGPQFDSKTMGFSGDPCEHCGQPTLIRNGSCLKCMSCGGSTGCS